MRNVGAGSRRTREAQRGSGPRSPKSRRRFANGGRVPASGRSTRSSATAQTRRRTRPSASAPSWPRQTLSSGGYDQDAWAKSLDYHSHPIDLALDTVQAVRAHTAALLRRLPEEAWSREGTHTESGRYTAEQWLAIYAEHLENHARQIERNLEAWRSGRP